MDQTAPVSEPLAQSELSKPLVHELQNDNESQGRGKQLLIGIVVFLIAIGLGAGSGYMVAARSTSGPKNGETPKLIQQGNTVGYNDTKTYRDSAEGVIKRNEPTASGYSEGSHILVRSNDPSQTAYLTSSAVDLDMYVDKKVRVWGETNKGFKVAWLMDVGKIELLQ